MPPGEADQGSSDLAAALSILVTTSRSPPSTKKAVEMLKTELSSPSPLHARTRLTPGMELLITPAWISSVIGSCEIITSQTGVSRDFAQSMGSPAPSVEQAIHRLMTSSNGTPEALLNSSSSAASAAVTSNGSSAYTGRQEAKTSARGQADQSGPCDGAVQGGAEGGVVQWNPVTSC